MLASPPTLVLPESEVLSGFLRVVFLEMETVETAVPDVSRPSPQRSIPATLAIPIQAP